MNTPFPMQGTKGSQDKRNLVSLVVPWYAPSYAEIFTVGRDSPVAGLMEEDRDFDELEAGGFRVNVKWEGVPDGVPDDKETFEFAPSFSEEPLPAHPDWPKIKAFYKGSVDANGNVKFAEHLKNSGGTGLAGGDKGKKKNPLFGSTTFLSLKAVFRWTYLRRNLPADFLSKVGQIRKSLPGDLPTPELHDWLITPPVAAGRGSMQEIREEWLLSPKGGWPKEVYKLINF